MTNKTVFKIGVACGGTGGHIFPGLATARVLREAGHDVTIWLAGKSVEATATSQWDGPVQRIQAEGLPSGFSLKTIRAAFRLLKAVLTCRKRMRENRPDVLLAMGSYASVGPVTAAYLLGVPVVLHEANVIPGKAIQWLARRASAIGVAFSESSAYLHNKRIVPVGMPLRREIETIEPSKYPEGLDRRFFTFFVMGGSGGAHRLNELASDAFVLMQAEGRAFQVIHLTGQADAVVVDEKYRAHHIPSLVKAFDHDMPSLYHAADFAVCRSGAATCAELAIYGMPALFVPYPFAASNHQLKNAEAMAAGGMADVCEESALTAEWLKKYLSEMMVSPDRIAAMSAAAKRCAKYKAAEQLAALVGDVAGEQAAQRKRPC